MLKAYIYLNILFIFGLVVYLFSQKIGIEFYNLFYLFFGLFSLFIPFLFIIYDFKFRNREERIAYLSLFYGFLIYGACNLLWYLNEALFEIIDFKFLNFLFIFQCFTKHYFLRYLSINDKKNKAYFSTLFSINIGILLFALFFSSNFHLESYILDIYFIIESLLTVIFIFYYLKESFNLHIDLRYFLYGNLIWLVADILFLIENFTKTYFMGNVSDFIYYIGLYMMLYSILIKNFNYKEKIDFVFDLNLKLS